MKIISLCNLNKILSKENYFDKLFLVNALLILQNESFNLRSLINSDSVIYMIIHINLVDRVCKELKIQSISLTKEKLIKEYDEKIFKKTITHKILLNLIIESYKKLTVSMLIADIDHHEVILEKSWMNKNEILLNMQIDIIVFSNQLNTLILIFSISLNSKHLSWLQLTLFTFIFQSKISRMLKRSVSTMIQKESFSIWSINVTSFKTLLNRSKKNQTEVFILFMKNIDRKIAYNTQCNLNALNVSFIEKTTQNLKAIKVKLSSEYDDFLNVFDRAQLNKLSSHCFYDHKIELISDSTLSCCQVYQMFSVKLLKVKKYLNENLLKRFITLSQTFYFFSVLFALKANEDLRFCVNYWKLNIIFKRNKYSLLLIDKIIDKIVNCKHLTKLNIISAFNKLQMHLNNENYITFITALEAYKYKMLSFKLTNKLIFFQQYMNDVLWNFLNDFYQVYLNDILIYSKTRKKHRDHVKLVLNRLCEAELQMNIQKCEFNVEEIVFLKVIISKQDLCINSSKIIIIVNWTTSINLKEIQSFVKFVNFYCCFIRNFFKLVKSFTQLTRKDTFFVWNEVCIQAFRNLKKQISFASVLRYFNLKHQTILKIDALNYVKDEILSQYDDENVLHSMIFYSKSIILAEINYHIYDKKLLIIIRCFKHWWLKLKCTELLIQIFINHQALKNFMKNKQLSQHQVNYLNILSKFNFQIIFRSGKMNTKVDALTWMSLANVSESAKRFKNRFQTILIFDRVDILSIDSKLNANSKSEVNLYQKVQLVNQMNKLCSEYKQAKNDNKLKLYSIKIKNCEIINDVLFRKRLL